MRQAKRSVHIAHVPVDISKKYNALLDEARDHLFRMIDYRCGGAVPGITVQLTTKKYFRCACGSYTFTLHKANREWFRCDNCGSEYQGEH